MLRRANRKSLKIAGLTALPLVAVVLVGWASRGPTAEELANVARADANVTAQDSDLLAPGSASPNASARGTVNVNASAARIAADNERRNAAARKDNEAFAADGWTSVKADEPNPKLTALDPSLLNGHEQELRTQLASTAASPAMVGNLVEIIKSQGAELQTRLAAVDSLGRIASVGAQDGLLSLLDTLDAQDPVRREVAPLLRPQSIDDKTSLELLRRLDSRNLSAVEKKQLAFTLALVSLRDGQPIPQAARAALSPEAQALLSQMRELASAGRDADAR
ncbi:MAG: hypothetical protein JST92_15920 [Deltaproteobacteria bacterium]|nr:hypothetical protein [Deltaproteobacteria bacterium]